MVQNGQPYLSIKKKIRWTARGKTWKYWGPTTQLTATPNHPPKPNQPLVNQLEVLGLDLIDSQSSFFSEPSQFKTPISEKIYRNKG